MLATRVQWLGLWGLCVGLGACASPIQPADRGSSNTGGLVTSGGAPIDMGGVIMSTGGITGDGGATATGAVMATGGISAPAVPSDLPCDVQAALGTYCWKCHGNPTNWSGPMSLVTQTDFLATGKITTTAVVRDLVKARLHDTAKPMPPPTELAITADALAVLDGWLDAGTPLGDGSSCEPTTGTGGTGADSPVDWSIGPGWPGGVEPVETCYQFLKHGQQTENDTTPYNTPVGETYANFFFRVPWTEPVVATHWRTVFDQTQVLHHWLLYQSSAAVTSAGTWTSVPANGLAGQHGVGAKLLGAWAVGGNGEETFPVGVGMQMPAPGGMFELEWHNYNTTAAEVPDRSGVEVCVVPESAVDPKYIAGLTWLGTEDLVINPNAETKRGGVCAPSFAKGGPISIIKWLPHMHLTGVHMDNWVMRANGTEEHVFSEPFKFDFQIYHTQNPPLVLNQGDQIDTVCTFQNNTSGTILFGQSTDTEMCYQFAVSFPAGSLDSANPISSLTGSQNACLSGNTLLPHSN